MLYVLALNNSIEHCILDIFVVFWEWANLEIVSAWLFIL